MLQRKERITTKEEENSGEDCCTRWELMWTWSQRANTEGSSLARNQAQDLLARPRQPVLFTNGHILVHCDVKYFCLKELCRTQVGKKYSRFESISSNRKNFTLSHFVTSNIQYQTTCQPMTFFQLTPLFPQINQVHAPLSPPLCSSSRPPECQVQLGHPSPSLSETSQSGLSGFFFLLLQNV